MAGKVDKESKKKKKSKSAVAKVAAAVTKKLKGKKKAKASDAEAEDSGVKLMTAKAATKKLKKKLGHAPTDDEVAAFVTKINKKRSKKGTKRKADDDDDSDEGAGEADAAPAKKAKKAKKDKKEKDAPASAEAEVSEAAGDAGDADGGEAEAGQISMDKPFKKGPKVNTPFRRVISENIVVHKELEDNTYGGTFGEDGWGAKASAILLTTKGKSFRHEKTKKKRGSYRGGEINASAINSTKITFADNW